MHIGQFLTKLIVFVTVCIPITSHLSSPTDSRIIPIDNQLLPNHFVSQELIASISTSVNVTSTPDSTFQQSGVSFLGSFSPSPSLSPGTDENSSEFDLWDKVIVPILVGILGFAGAILGGVVAQNHAKKISDKQKKEDNIEAADRIIRDILGRFDSDLCKPNTVALSRFNAFKEEIDSIKIYRERKTWDADIAHGCGIEMLLKTIETTINSFSNGKNRDLSAQIREDLKNYLNNIPCKGD